MFKNYDGLNEMMQFSDLYHILMINPSASKCPICDNDMNCHVYTGFNMNQVGHATFECKNTVCHFHRNHLVIEAIGRNEV